MADVEEVEVTLLALLAEREVGRSLDPTEVARSLGGPHPDRWSPYMPIVRRAAIRLAKAGRLVILRKGRPVDPDEFRGIYRLALPSEAAP